MPPTKKVLAAKPWRNRIVGHGEENPEQLLANPLNFRIHPKDQQETLMGVLNEVGWVQDIIVNRRTGHVIDGHLRVQLALRRDEQTVPVVYVDLSEEEERLILATIDPISALAKTDAEKLDELLQGVATTDAAIQKLLADLADDAGLYKGNDEDEVVGEAPDAEMDRATELGQKWGTKPGQLWIIPSKSNPGSAHRLLCGDSQTLADVEHVLGGVQADMVWTDPPYGVAYVGKTKDALRIANDTLEGQALQSFLRKTLGNAFRVSKPGAVWYVAAPGGPENLHFAIVLTELEIWRQTIIWAKDVFVIGHSDFHWKHEPLFYGWKPGAAHKAPPDRKQDTLWTIDRPKRSQEHPTMKPVELVVKSLRLSSERSDIVLDIFCGSGTTLVACEQTGRVGCGIEHEAKYCGVILERLSMMGLAPQLAEEATT